MWVLDNRTKYAAERNWVRDKAGVHHWLVAVRASFDIGETGQLRLADEQPLPVLEPVYRGDPTISSLLLDSDLFAVKPSTDVLFNGCAHAPRGRMAASVPVEVRIGALKKQLVAHGPRVYYRGPLGLTTTSPKPFTSTPIVYEDAFGGLDIADPEPRKRRMDLRNPVGRGVAMNPATLEHKAAHNIEYPSGDATKVGPAGFGPIGPSWAPRLQRAGTYDARWAASKKPLLPDDYDDLFAMSAPDDQRPPKHLRGGESIVVVNMTPAGLLGFDLPRLAFGFTTSFSGYPEQDNTGNLTAVHVDTEKLRLSMVWQSALAVPARQVEHLDETEIFEKRVLR